MASVTAFTADRMKQIEDTTVVSGLVGPDGHLLLSTREGTEIDAGNVVGPQGPGFVHRGSWAEATDYEANDVVVSEGSTFVVIADHTSSTTPPTVETPGAGYALWAEKGEDGIIGKDGDTAIPAGTISLWASDVAPANWLICDGSAVSRTAYPSLFDSIGIKYGAGDGVNTFNLPNLKGRTPIGLDTTQIEFDALGKVGGAKTHVLSQSEMPAHRHDTYAVGIVSGRVSAPATRNGFTMTGGWNYVGVSTGPDSFGDGKYISELTGNGAAHNILQPYSVVNFIIKATAGETPGDSELATRISELEENFSSTPAGTMTMWPSDVAPTNWLLCNGAAVSRTTYASLFAAIGTKYGEGDGLTTFNLPDLQGRVPVGKNSGQLDFSQLGKAGGTMSHTHSHLSPIGMASNNMYILPADQTVLDGQGTYDFSFITQSTDKSQAFAKTGAGAMEIHKVTSTASGTLQPFQVVNYIIKFTNGDTKGDSQLTQRVSQLEALLNQSALVLRDRMERARNVLTGGGLRNVGTDGIRWNSRFLIVGHGWEDPALSGSWDIVMPPNGTVIPVYGSTTRESVTVAADTIPIPVWHTLYYEIPLDSNYASKPGNFRIVEYTKKLSFTPPPNWIMLVTRNGDAINAPAYTWGDGRQQDIWRTIGLLNGWLQYGGYSLCRWRWTSSGSIRIKGLMYNGATAVAIADWGPTLGPGEPSIYLQAVAAGMARIDINSNGQLVLLNYMSGGNNSWVSLENIEWYPKVT